MDKPWRLQCGQLSGKKTCDKSDNNFITELSHPKCVRYTSKLVLAGDHLQLPPTVLSNSLKVKAVLGVSMMERLVKEFKGSSMVRMLDTQYRMAEAIMRWPSDTFYDGRLKAGPGIGNKTLATLPGVRPALLITKKQLLLVDTKGKMRQKGSNAPVQNPLSASLQNPGEAETVVKIVKQLSHSGVMPDQIGVISFYALQVDKIRFCQHYYLRKLLI